MLYGDSRRLIAREQKWHSITMPNSCDESTELHRVSTTSSRQSRHEPTLERVRAEEEAQEAGQGRRLRLIVEPDDFQPSELRVADTKKLEERSLKCDFYYWASRAAPVFCGSYADRCATPITLAIIMDNVGRVKYPAREDRRKEYQALEEELQSRGVRIPDQEKDFVRSRRQYEATREAPWKHQTSVQKVKARPMHPTYGR